FHCDRVTESSRCHDQRRPRPRLLYSVRQRSIRFPFRPVAVSPFSRKTFFTPSGMAILWNERLWIRLPSLPSPRFSLLVDTDRLSVIQQLTNRWMRLLLTTCYRKIHTIACL